MTSTTADHSLTKVIVAGLEVAGDCEIQGLSVGGSIHRVYRQQPTYPFGDFKAGRA